MIQTVIVEDEPKSAAALQNLIRAYCPTVQVAGMAQSVRSGIDLIRKVDPDLVFLDIAMPDGDGFEVLTHFPENRSFEVIFTTAYEEYAIKAFDYSAMNYLLKPIHPEELQKVVRQFERRRSKGFDSQRMEVLMETLQQRFDRIALPTQEGVEYVEVASVVRCEADGGYTVFHLKEGRRILVSKSLSSYEELLPQDLFCRIHHKHLVNLHFVQRYLKGGGGRVSLKNGEQLDVSVRRKDTFLKAMEAFIQH